MSILINNIKTSVEDSAQIAIEKGLKLLGLSSSQVKSIEVSKVSLDARKKQDMKLVYSLVASIEGDEKVLVESLGDNNIRYLEDLTPEFKLGDKPMSHPPVVVGFGPCGIFAALTLAKQGYNPIVIERGAAMADRVKAVEGFWKKGMLDTKSNVQFGEGGAGTFSDGKLTTRVKDVHNSFVLQELVKHGAPEEILHKGKPHIGTDKLRGVVASIRQEIISLGGKVVFDTQLEDIKIEDGKVTSIKFADSWQPVEVVILAIGHSARDTFYMLNESGVNMTSKPFSVGVRIEQLQSSINKGLYGEMAESPLLPIGEYQLSHRQGEKCVYTFCMCPGGVVVPSASEENTVVVNGMSYHARDGANSNCALAVSVDQKDFGTQWDDGIKFQRKLEKLAFNPNYPYKAPMQSVGNFLKGKPGVTKGRITPTYSIGGYDGDFNKIFPKDIVDMMKVGLNKFQRNLNGFADEDCILTGVETRTSSPVRIPRDESLQSTNAKGLYPAGEGAGYAGGIMSGALDGIKCAVAIMNIYKPFEK